MRKFLGFGGKLWERLAEDLYFWAATRGKNRIKSACAEKNGKKLVERSQKTVKIRTFW